MTSQSLPRGNRHDISRRALQSSASTSASARRLITAMRRPSLYLASLLLSVAACTDEPTRGVIVPAPAASQLRSSLTEAAALSLDADGKLVLPVAKGASGYPELTADEASAFATAWIKQFAAMVHPFLERTRGASIDLNRLAVCSRPLFARSAFAPPPVDVPAPYRRPYGPWWLITICDDGGTPTVSLAVSAWATDVTLADGKLTMPRFGGNEFFPLGIPFGHTGEFPSAPEKAVVLAARATGRRVSGIPVLLMPTRDDGPPQAARWHLVLDSVASVRSTRGATVRTAEAFVGNPRVTEAGIRTFIPAAQQPSTTSLTWSPGPLAGENGEAYMRRMNSEQHHVEIARRTDAPLRFDMLDANGGH